MNPSLRFLIFWPALALLSACASPDPNCPANGRALPPGALYGAWEARIGGADAPAMRMRLSPHPDYAGVRGELQRAPQLQPPAQLAGDINDEGLLLLDESEDGRSISAVWEGEMQARSCGRVFRGQWRRAGEDQALPFVLTRLPTAP